MLMRDLFAIDILSVLHVCSHRKNHEIMGIQTLMV